MKSNMGRYKKLNYADLIRSDYWDTAVECGFLSQQNIPFNLGHNNDLEEGLGYIFFNTLRAKLHGTVQHDNLERGLWVSNEDEDNVRYIGFRSPKPWKYEVRNINGENYGVFYLDCVLMGEYHRFNNRIIRNYNKVGDDGAPHTNIYYHDRRHNDQNAELESNSVVVHIDHLLKDNSYLIELPENLHNLKTRVLDPFIRWAGTETERTFNRRQYWNLNHDYQRIENGQQNLDMCPCGDEFRAPNRNRIERHTHIGNWNVNFTTNWMPKMKGNNMP